MRSLFLSRFILAGILAALALVTTGCESTRHDVGGRIREKFTGPVYQQRHYAASYETVFAEARRAVEQLGFNVTRAGQAQGLIDGIDRVMADDTLRGGRQRTISVRVQPEAVEARVRVEVLISDVVEDDFSKGAGQATQAPLRDSPLYSIYFRMVEQALAAP